MVGYENEMYLIKDLKKKAETVGSTELVNLVEYDAKQYTDDFSAYAQLLKRIMKFRFDKSTFCMKVISECDRALNMLCIRG